MNFLSRTITGILAIIGGLILIFFSFTSTYWLLIYGIPLLVVGIFILFNKKEDNIEKRKDKK
jgi:uncharacterized membrane protein HdeD (DUF308 family)